MPRITFENFVSVGGGIVKIEKTEYSLPDCFFYKDEKYTFSKYHNVYVNQDGTKDLSPEEYLNFVLENDNIIGKESMLNLKNELENMSVEERIDYLAGLGFEVEKKEASK